MTTPCFLPSPDVPNVPLYSQDAIIFCADSAAPLSIPTNLMTEICKEASDGFRAVPRGGAEVGGLLLGEKMRAGVAEVRQIFPIEIEYRYGPAFRPSPADLASLQQVAFSLQSDPFKKVIGFYRSITRPPSQLRDSDQEILAALQHVHTSYTADFRFLMMLAFDSIRSFSIQVSAAEDGVWCQWQQYLLRLPLPSEKSLPETGTLAKPVSEAIETETLLAPQSPACPSTVTALELPTSRMQSAPAVKTGKPRKPRLRLAPLLFVSLGLLMLGGLGRVYFQTEARRQAASRTAAVSNSSISHTGFAASPEGGMWKLTWNREVVMSMNPTTAFLSIRDGANQEEIPLTTADLATGMVFYTPKSGDLLFGLRVLTAGLPTIEERVRVLQAVRPSQAPAQPHVMEKNNIRTLRPFVPPAQALWPINSGAATLDKPPVIADNAPRGSQISLVAIGVPPAAPPPPPAPLVPTPDVRPVSVSPVSIQYQIGTAETLH